MPTTEPLPWQRKDYESRYGPASRFTSPSGFVIELVGTSNVVRLLTKLGFTMLTTCELPDGTRFIKDHANLVLIDTEPWLNPDFQVDDVIGDVDGLVAALGHFLLEKAWTK